MKMEELNSALFLLYFYSYKNWSGDGIKTNLSYWRPYRLDSSYIIAHSCFKSVQPIVPQFIVRL